MLTLATIIKATKRQAAYGDWDCRPMMFHPGADGTEKAEPLPDEPVEPGRKREKRKVK